MNYGVTRVLVVLSICFCMASADAEPIYRMYSIYDGVIVDSGPFLGVELDIGGINYSFLRADGQLLAPAPVDTSAFSGDIVDWAIAQMSGDQIYNGHVITRSSAVPEPGSLVLWLVSGGVLGVARAFKSRSQSSSSAS